MTHNSKVQVNVFALVKIFNAVPSPSFSAAAELRIINPTTGPYVMLILFSYLLIWRAQYTLGDNMGTSHLGTPYISILDFYQ
jgi:hypothetical protein